MKFFTTSLITFLSTLLILFTFTTSAPVGTVLSRSGDVHTGDATWYNPGLGSCGVTNTDSDMIVALSHIQYENGSPNPCGRQIQVNFGGKSVTCTVEDKCMGCAENAIDLSPAAFSQLCDQSVGRITVTWNFI